MCGRYGLISVEKLKSRYTLENDLADYRNTYNIAPGFDEPVITKNSPNYVQLMRWGLIPSWSKDIKIGYKMINARSETITEKSSFKKPFKTQRCLVPASLFFEWQRSDNKTKIPYCIKLKDQEMFSLAGLYEVAKIDGQEVKSYTILTCEPNKFMEPIHDRMPVILEKEDEETWLNIDTPEEVLLNLLKPFSSTNMEAFKVSRLVNSPANQVKGVIDPV